LPSVPLAQQPSAAYLIWHNPVMLAGADTFIDDMLFRCGFRNVCPANQGHYPSVTTEGLKALKPDFLLLSSEPYPFKEKHKEAWQERMPGTQVILVDGELFSWYGSRLAKAPEYFLEVRKAFVAGLR
ncbi:MAG: cobalamin-binding protein, partial [Flavobacteriales bacterium]|nr:cobalamin-binding protein [Flavobacteriales bacterium]